jgi:hypothetical protein
MNSGRKIFGILLALGLVIFINNIAYAGPPAPPGVPIDGGISVLIALSVGYGAKQILQKEDEDV